MKRRQLGDTGLQISEMALGAGGGSQLGLSRGASTEEATQVVRRALELGVNYVDTAPAYGTEEAVGGALAEVARDEVVVSTKFRPRTPDGGMLPPDALRESLEESLRRLATDHVDILFVHGVRPWEYDFCLEAYGPVLTEQREAGKVRSIGVTESFANDPEHAMQQRALDDPIWEVLLTGFNVLNPTARSILPRAAERGVGVVVMHAIRWLLTDVERLREGLGQLLDGSADDVPRDRLRAAIQQLPVEGADGVLPAAAYRFALDALGVSSVLIGTGNVSHLEQNLTAVQSIHDNPLAAPLLEVLDGLLKGTAAGSGDRVT